LLLLLLPPPATPHRQQQQMQHQQLAMAAQEQQKGTCSWAFLAVGGQGAALLLLLPLLGRLALLPLTAGMQQIRPEIPRTLKIRS
jgi:hypothetical protein